MSLSSFYNGVNNTYLTPGINSCLERVYGEGGDGNGVNKDLSYRFGKKNGKWIQSVVKKMKQKGTTGSFTRWCNRKGYNGVTQACINEGKKSKNIKTKKRAVFAQNIRGLRFGKKKSKSRSPHPTVKIKQLLKDIKFLQK